MLNLCCEQHLIPSGYGFDCEQGKKWHQSHSSERKIKLGAAYRCKQVCFAPDPRLIDPQPLTETH